MPGKKSKMTNLSRNQIQEIINDLENSVAHPECLTCDCFQGLLTQLELDCPQDVIRWIAGVVLVVAGFYFMVTF
jgi:hypothetical protein